MVALFTTEELSALRGLNDTYLPDLATILHGAELDDGEGGAYTYFGFSYDDPGVVYNAPGVVYGTETSPCRFRTLSGNELVQAQRLAAQATIEVVLPYSRLSEVSPEDRLIVTETETGVDHDLQVQYIPRSSYMAATRLLCKELSIGGA